MAIDDNTSYELTGAQVKDLAQRIQSGGGGSNAVILYSSVSFHTPIQLVDIYSDAALTTTVSGATVKGYIEAGKTVAIIYETSVSDVPQNETLIITSCDNHSEATHGVIVFTGTFFDYTNSKPVLYTLACDQPSNLWSASQKSIPTNTSELTNDGDDGVHPFLATDDVATVATTGAYSDLTGTPTIPAAQIQSDWTQATTTALDYIKNKPNLATVATSGSYTDLSNKPTIPTVNNATLTIQKNGTTVKTFTANSSTNVTANITVPTVNSSSTQLDVGSYHFWFFSFSNTASGWTTKDLTHPTAFRGKVKHVGCNGLWGNSGDNRLGAWLEYDNNTKLRLRVYQGSAGSNAWFGVAIAYY